MCKILSSCPVLLLCYRGQWSTYADGGQGVQVDSEWGGVLWPFLLWEYCARGVHQGGQIYTLDKQGAGVISWNIYYTG